VVLDRSAGQGGVARLKHVPPDRNKLSGRAHAVLQVWEWFRAIPDFILTFDASYASICTDVQWCALCEHELSHSGVERDAFGALKFKKSTGLPSFTLIGHDVEEFIGVVRRYGAAAAGVQAMIEARRRGPHDRRGRAPSAKPTHPSVAARPRQLTARSRSSESTELESLSGAPRRNMFMRPSGD
jgi:hypothetical protein